MTETIAHAALLSDRRSSRGQYEALLLVDHCLMAQTTEGLVPLTGKIVSARVLDWMDVPRSLLSKPGNGAVAVEDDRGQTFVIPIDAWWMAPPLAASLPVALESSGLSTLVERFGTTPSTSAIDQRASVILPLPRSAVSRAERTTRVLLLGSGVLLPLSAAAALLVAAFAHVLPPALWSVPELVMSLATIAASVSVVRGRKRVTEAAVAFRREVMPSGPRWFAENASIGVDERGRLVVVDGQGLWHRMETARSTSASAAVSNVVFSDQNGGCALLLDGTGTVRLQLGAALWYPEGSDRLRSFFHANGILTKAASDSRHSPDVALGLLTHVDEPKRSLSEQNALCVARVTPLAGGVLVPIVAAAISASAGQVWAAVLCVLAAAVNIGVIARISWVETSVRVGDNPVRRKRFPGVHLRGRALLLVALVVVCLLVAISAGRSARWDLVGIAIAILISVPTVMWVAYRRRSLIEGVGFLRLASWWASGAPPVEGTGR